MQKQPRVVPPQELRQHVLRLARAARQVHRLQDRDDVLEEELGVLASAPRGRVLVIVAAAAAAPVRGVRAEEGEDLEFPAYPHPGAGDELLVLAEEGGRELAVAREAVGADVLRVPAVEVHFLPAAQRGGRFLWCGVSRSALAARASSERCPRPGLTRVRGEGGRRMEVERRGRGLEVGEGLAGRVADEGVDGGAADGAADVGEEPGRDAEVVEGPVGAGADFAGIGDGVGADDALGARL